MDKEPSGTGRFCSSKLPQRAIQLKNGANGTRRKYRIARKNSGKEKSNGNNRSLERRMIGPIKGQESEDWPKPKWEGSTYHP